MLFSASRRIAFTPKWARDVLWRRARAAPSLDLRFADNKSLVDATTGQNLATFTRASSGTYVDSQGVIRTATTNLLVRSEEFDNASWTKIASTVLANQIQSPVGTLTADEIIEDLSTGNHYATNSTIVSSVSGTVYTYSVYLKAGQRNFCFVLANGTGTLQSVSVNLSTGAATSAIGSPSNITSASIGNGWYRVSFTYTSGTTGSVGHEVRLSTDGVWANRSYTGNGTGSVYAWGAQLEQSSTVGEYIPTTSTINSAPRFDHNPTTGESLGLLVEEQRTNSIRNNTMVGAVAGTPGTAPTNWTITSSATGLTRQIVGTGTESGITYIDVRYSGTSTSTGSLQFSPDTTTGIPALTGQTWTGAFYVRLVGGSLPGPAAWVWLERDSGGAIVVSGSGGSAPVTEDPLNSQRRTTTRTLSGGATVANLSLRIDITVPNTTAVDVTLRIGLPQLEQGAFTTSVIPTTTAAATRSADVASISGSNFSSWYRQDEGTLRIEGVMAPVLSRFPTEWSLSDGTDNNRIDGYNFTSGYYATIRKTGETNTDPALLLAPTSGVLYQKAVAIKSGDYRIAAQGQQAASLNPVFIPTVSELRIGSTRAGGGVHNSTIRRLTFWPQRLPNSTLQTITQ